MSFTVLLQLNPEIATRWHYHHFTDEQMDEAILNREFLNLNLTTSYTNAHGLFIVSGYREIAKRYNIIDNTVDSLLCFILEKNEDVYTQLDHYNENIASKKRAKQVAQLILAYEQGKSYDSSITYKTLTETVKVSDATLTNWIVGLVKEALEERNYPLGQMGDDFNIMILGEQANINRSPLDQKRLEDAASKSVYSSSRYKTKYFTHFCIHLLEFLNSETHLKPEPGVRLSNEQLCFIYDIGKLLGWISIEHLQTERPDYMHSLFANFIKYNPLT